MFWVRILSVGFQEVAFQGEEQFFNLELNFLVILIQSLGSLVFIEAFVVVVDNFVYRSFSNFLSQFRGFGEFDLDLQLVEYLG